MVASSIREAWVIEQCCAMSTPASNTDLRPSADSWWVWMILPAACTASTMARCCSGVKRKTFSSPVELLIGLPSPLAPYFTKSTPSATYFVISSRTWSGVFQERSGPPFFSNMALMRFWNAGVAASIDAEVVKTARNPTMSPAINMRLPGISPLLIRSRTRMRGSIGPIESKTVVKPYFKATCAASSTRPSKLFS